VVDKMELDATAFDWPNEDLANGPRLSRALREISSRHSRRSVGHRADGFIR
jgi:hypothetical protein